MDDSAVARAFLHRAIEARGTLKVAGAVSTAAGALAFLTEQRVELVILDVQLPGVDGLTALPDILAAGHGARVLIVSSACGEGATTAVQALALGAADTLVKPGFGQRSRDFENELVVRLERMLQSGPAPVPSALPRSEPAAFRVEGAADAWGMVAIGASTGGIHALSQLLRAIPASMQVPILVTQHLPASFTPFFATQLSVLAGRPCDIADDRLRVRPGRVVVAPGNAHLRLVPIGEGACAVRLSTEPSRSGCLPSVDPMFESVADCFGARGLGIVLSGMGRDGEIGAKRLADAGGCIVAQDRASSAVWGMPGAVANAGITSAVLPPEQIGRLVATGRRPSC